MSVYTPDLWVIVEVKYNDDTEVTRKVLASWYGGYGGSDSWRLSSGITEIVDCDTYYEIHNESGSVYKCAKNAQSMSGYTASVYANLRKKLEGTGIIEAIDYEHTN
jgi:hypothetical protein